MTTALLAASAVVLNGLLAGLLFAFVCAVSPAYRRLSDEEFVRGFRAVNEAILGPSFLVVFFGPRSRRSPPRWSARSKRAPCRSSGSGLPGRWAPSSSR